MYRDWNKPKLDKVVLIDLYNYFNVVLTVMGSCIKCISDWKHLGHWINVSRRWNHIVSVPAVKHVILSKVFVALLRMRSMGVAAPYNHVRLTHRFQLLATRIEATMKFLTRNCTFSILAVLFRPLVYIAGDISVCYSHHSGHLCYIIDRLYNTHPRNIIRENSFDVG